MMCFRRHVTGLLLAHFLFLTGLFGGVKEHLGLYMVWDFTTRPRASGIVTRLRNSLKADLLGYRIYTISILLQSLYPLWH